MRNIILILLVVTIGACQEQAPIIYTFPQENTSLFEEQLVLKKVGTKSLKLDSTIGITNQSIVSFQEGQKEYVSIFNEYDGSVHVYDYDSGDRVFKTIFDLEGPNGVGKKSNMGHIMTSLDSIFLFNHWESRVYLMSSDGKLIRKYDLMIEDLPFEFYLMINSTSPAFKIDNDLYISSQSGGFSMNETRYLIKLDLISAEVEWYVSGPEFLDKAFWGPMTPFTFSLTLNTKTNQFVTSMAKNPETRVFDVNNLASPTSRRVVGSQFVDAFTSFEKKNSTRPMFGHNYKDIASKTNKKPLFLSIQYDNYRDLFYRTILLERNQQEYELREKGMQTSIIITDSDLKKIGETLLPKGLYKNSLMFINKDGLHLANLKEYENNENELVFDIFLPSKK